MDCNVTADAVRGNILIGRTIAPENRSAMIRNPPPRGAPPRGPVRTAPQAAPRAKADLSTADSSSVLHNLYVKIVPKDHPDKKSQKYTLSLLHYIHGRIKILKEMGIQVKVNKISASDLQNAKLNAAMKKKGITKLPAMTTPTGVYLGVDEIADVYERNIREFTANQRRDEKKVAGIVQEDDLDSYYRDEMTFERAEEDEEEPGIGEDGDMMSAYHSMVQRRDELNAKRKPTRAPARGEQKGERPARPDRGGRPGAGRPGTTPARPGQSTRPDNLGGDDDEISTMINRMSSDIDSGTMETAFQSGGGDSLEGGGDGDSAQDRIMESAYWANQEAST